MAKTSVAEEKPGLWERLTGFKSDVVGELKKVSWPTLEDLKISTKVTMYMLVIMGIIMFVFDKIFEISIFALLNIAS